MFLMKTIIIIITYNFQFFFFNHLHNFKCEERTIGGDLNLVLDIYKDKKGVHYRKHFKSAKPIITETIADWDLVDA